jgi:hypothetical protein
VTGLPLWDRLQAAEAKVVARIRAGVAALSLIGAAEAHTFAEMISYPSAEVWIKRAAGVSLVLAFLMRAGDKTPENVKQLADSAGPSVPGQT